jgi:flagellum-specific peptidoglycan hydrolase FlgJ
MAGSSKPGTTCLYHGSKVPDAGTNNLQWTPPPGILQAFEWVEKEIKFLEKFLEKFPPAVVTAAIASRDSWDIPASVTLAQWALESSWGTRMPIGSNNPFGIKARAGDSYVEAKTTEVIAGKVVVVTAKFRKFQSINDAFNEHGKLLATADAYSKARQVRHDPDKFADALTGVYATDTKYGTSLKTMMKAYNLYLCDNLTLFECINFEMIGAIVLRR